MTYCQVHTEPLEVPAQYNTQSPRMIHCQVHTELLEQKTVMRMTVIWDDANYNRLDNVRELQDVVINQWQANFYPRQQITGDETIIPFKGTT